MIAWWWFAVFFLPLLFVVMVMIYANFRLGAQMEATERENVHLKDQIRDHGFYIRYEYDMDYRIVPVMEPEPEPEPPLAEPRFYPDLAG